MFWNVFQTEQNYAVLFLRLALAVAIFPHGAQKLLGWFGGFGYKGTMGYFTQTLGIPTVFGFLAIIAEFFGSLALFAGFLTRPAAFGIGVVMLVAALKVHLPYGFFTNWFGNQKGEGYEYFILTIGMALTLMIAGGGAWSLDQALAGVFPIGS
jgi:putative oxidoreductase